MGWVVAFPRDRTSRGTSLDNPLSLCPGTKAGAKIPGQNHFPPKNQKTGKGRSKTEKRRSKTGKDILKQKRTFKNRKRMFKNRKRTF